MEKLFIPLLVSCVTGGKIVLINKVNFVLLRLKQKKARYDNISETYAEQEQDIE